MDSLEAPRYRLTDLRHFVDVAGCATLGQAARKLGVTQPALSQSIRRLETDLGIVLLYRSRSGIQLTPSGRAVLAKAQEAVQSLDAVAESASRTSGFAGRTISIGCHPLVAQYTIPRALTYLRKVAPDYRIELRHDLSRVIQSHVQRGAIDVGIAINATEMPDLVVRKLGLDNVCVWTSRPRQAKDTIFCDPNLFQTQSILKRWKKKPPKLVTTDSLELICRLTALGLGYGIIPERALELTGVALERVPSLPMYRDEICLVFRPEFGKTLAERLVIDALRRSVEAGAPSTS